MHYIFKYNQVVFHFESFIYEIYDLGNKTLNQMRRMYIHSV